MKNQLSTDPSKDPNRILGGVLAAGFSLAMIALVGWSVFRNIRDSKQ